jgi:hypothetical protein
MIVTVPTYIYYLFSLYLYVQCWQVCHSSSIDEKRRREAAYVGALDAGTALVVYAASSASAGVA